LILNIETANFNLCFALWCLNLWNGYAIDINPDHFSTRKGHIFQYFLLTLQITWLYTCGSSNNSCSYREIRRIFCMTVTKLVMLQITIFSYRELNRILTDFLKALRNSGHVVPQQNVATVLCKRFLRVGACTCDVMLYGACAGNDSSYCAIVGECSLLGSGQRINEIPEWLWRVRDTTIEQLSQAVFSAVPLGTLIDYISRPTKLNSVSVQ
jgi:hypothetical protein